MQVSKKQAALQELQQVPGVGKKIAETLWTLGIRSIADLQGREPEELFSQLQARAGARVDHAVLHVFRCAVYLLPSARAPRARTPELVARKRPIVSAYTGENAAYPQSLLISTQLW